MDRKQIAIMTREEAREFLIDISYKFGNMDIEYLTEKDGEKMREAIKVLEQEPCDVAISKQAVLKYVEGSDAFYKIKVEIEQLAITEKDLSRRVDNIETQMKKDKEERLKNLKADLDYAKFQCALNEHKFGFREALYEPIKTVTNVEEKEVEE